MSSGLLVTTGIMATWIQAAPAVLPLFACATHTAFCTSVDDLVLGVFLTEKLFLVCGWCVVEIQSSRCFSQNSIRFLRMYRDTRLKTKLMENSVLVFMFDSRLEAAHCWARP